MSLLRHSRIASTLTKIALPWKAMRGALWRNKLPIAGTALVGGMTGMGVNDALKRERAGATPEWVEYNRNRGVPAAPKL